ncbi:(Fe-S)-binding protein [Cytophaga hutchinsonii]|uniref:Possible oxidoreductase, Fe-S subunit n=1 Tax=Cytophaga hutchinsonii (strain ATCC 33406 / DSM 1761 / CIP 103989 / NBRC 15051 / NCIMB 9469 / D465) TaxID=269798 RepID=A0A6N4SMC5_CYTH3|nr:(Fe-S)-binding protein [Cytophaga hutchinsonii]ABG57415.1 possible oxidoreductase, Fe-S subunit [Cytophaga hutchinsonii ATCC 33406]SFX97753.1 4Fe-4S dicluster domain-containing protein [Cytophaga hutchinsonii ATCC 33406]
MHVAAQIIFILLLSAAGAGIYLSIRRIRKNILLGRDEDRSDNKVARIKNMLLMALGQKKMFKKPLPAILHFFVYAGFLIVNIEMLEIAIDGIFGTHRIFAPYLGSFYPIIINVFEFLALTVIIACAVFLVRRNILHVRRLSGTEMTKWPLLDANLILGMEILLMIAFLKMNAMDQVLQDMGNQHYTATGSFFLSSLLKGFYTSYSEGFLLVAERACWWFHIIGVMFFANYVFYNSKHLHIFMAFINTYYAKLTPAGKLTNMPEVTKEVKLMLNLPVEETAADAAPGRFGAKDVKDLTWKNLLDAYSCTECGRCTQQCPANITGKKLSPRKIMMDTRDRLEEVGKNIKQHGADYDDGKALLGDYISQEELLACTTCNACVEACPVTIDPVSIIMQLRRFKLMEESQAPASWNSMLSNIENNMAPWKFSPADRFNWADKLKS